MTKRKISVKPLTGYPMGTNKKGWMNKFYAWITDDPDTVLQEREINKPNF